MIESKMAYSRNSSLLRKVLFVLSYWCIIWSTRSVTLSLLKPLSSIRAVSRYSSSFLSIFWSLFESYISKVNSRLSLTWSERSPFTANDIAIRNSLNDILPLLSVSNALKANRAYFCGLPKGNNCAWSLMNSFKSIKPVGWSA